MYNQPDTIAKAKALRAYYADDNQVGLALDALIKDFENGATTDQTRADAEKVKELVGPKATAYRVINELLI